MQIAVNENEKKVLDFIRKSGVAQVVAMLPDENRIATSEPPKGPEHDRLVRRLAHHAHCPFTRDELKPKPTEELERLDAMARGKTVGDVDLGFAVQDWHADPEDTTEEDSGLGFEVRSPYGD